MKTELNEDEILAEEIKASEKEVARLNAKILEAAQYADAKALAETEMGVLGSVDFEKAKYYLTKENRPAVAEKLKVLIADYEERQEKERERWRGINASANAPLGERGNVNHPSGY